MHFCRKRGTASLAALVSLSLCGVSRAAVSYVASTLSYSSPSDLSSTIDAPSPNLYLTVGASFGNTDLSTFQSLSGLQVISFNGAPGASADSVTTVTAQYSTTGMLSLTANNGAGAWNWGNRANDGSGRSAFSGSNDYDGLNTGGNSGAVQANATNWLDMGITTSDPAALGVTSFGFCADPRSDQGAWSHTGTVTFTLSDSTTATYSLTGALGTTDPTNYFFVGYTAPTGLYITNVSANRGGGSGNSNVPLDDISFVVTPLASPEPATASMLLLVGAAALLKRRQSHLRR